MNNVITTRFFAHRDDDIQETSEYLFRCGLEYTEEALREGLYGPFFYIQVRDMPEVINLFGTPDTFQKRPWELMKLTEHGAILYTALIDLENIDRGGDGVIFIPGSNIVAVHNRGEDWISGWL